MPISAAVVRTARSVARANGAVPSGIGSMPEQEVMHDRVADDRDLEDLAGRDPALDGQTGDQLGQRAADRPGHLAGALGMHHRVGDPAHEVLAEPDLGVHHPVRGEDRTVRQIGQVAGDGGRSDVDGHAVGSVVEAGPDAADGPSIVDGHGHLVVARGQGRLEGTDHLEVGLEAGQVPLLGEGVHQPGQVARGRGELRLGDLDVVQPDDRIDLEVAHVEALAHDLAVDLALGRDVDQDVALDGRCAAQATIGGKAVDQAILRLDLGRGREVLGQRGDAELGERADPGADLAAAADPPAAADRVDVDTERARGVEDGGALGETTPPSRRGEDDLAFGAVGHRRWLSRRPASRPGRRPADG